MSAIQPTPIEIDPRPCELCGLTIDRHQMVDDGEGPEFFCVDVPLDELTLDELERRDELRRDEEIAAMLVKWELADPRDRWRHTGELPPEPEPELPLASSRPRIAPSTIDAFKHVLSTGDRNRLAEWLRNHPEITPELLEGA